MDTLAMLDYAEVKSAYLEMYEGRDPFPDQRNFHERHDGSHRKGNTSAKSFKGATADEMFDWIQNGYSAPEFSAGEDYSPQRDEQTIVFGEEGELDLTLAWSGHDYPYLQWTPEERKPGIRIEAQMNWSAFVNPSVLAEYGAWLAGLLNGLETQGYDIELDLVSIQHHLYTDTRDPDVDKTTVRVKRENELTDFTEWSCMFSPGGFRHLFFTAYALGAHKLGKQINMGYGKPLGKGFIAEYDVDTATLFIGVNSSATSFPAEDMTRRVSEAMGW